MQLIPVLQEGVMKRFILGLIAVATIATVAPVSEAAVKALPPSSAPFTGAGADVGANVGGGWIKDRVADLDRLGVIRSYALRDSGAIGGGVPGSNFQYHQFACIRVGQRLQC
jgi:hypothetical protein